MEEPRSTASLEQCFEVLVDENKLLNLELEDIRENSVKLEDRLKKINKLVVSYLSSKTTDANGVLEEIRSLSANELPKKQLSKVPHEHDTTKDGFVCLCGTGCTSKSGLVAHIKYFTSGPKFMCIRCKRSFFSTSLLQAHMKRFHNVQFTGSNGCRSCGLCFSSRLKLYQHYKAAHNSGPLMKGVKGRRRNSDVIIHPEPEDPEKLCKSGPSTSRHTVRKKTVFRNSNTKHDIDSTKTGFVCLCGLIFRCKKYLSEHIRLKNGNKVFQCDTCRDAFSRFDYLKVHRQKIHHLATEGFGCRICGALGFLSRSQVKQHRLSAHSIPSS